MSKHILAPHRSKAVKAINKAAKNHHRTQVNIIAIVQYIASIKTETSLCF